MFATVSRVAPAAALSLATAVLFLTPAARAVEKNDVSSSASDEELLKELDREARAAGVNLELSPWDVSGSIETGVGYQDNVLLSAVTPDSSALVRGQVSALAWRLPAGGFEWFTTFDATATHYLAASKTDHALLAFARSEARWEASERLKFFLAAQYVHDDEVIDASTLESGLTSAMARVDSLALEPAVRWKLGSSWSVRLKTNGSLNNYRAPLDDFDDVSNELALEHSLGRWGNVALAWSQLDRRYRDRTQATRFGRGLPNTRLRVAQGGPELRYEIKGGESVRWRAKLSASFRENRDNGSGWYDYDRRALSTAWSVENDRWRLESEFGWMNYRYLIQTLGTYSRTSRRRDDWTGYARLERKLTPALTPFVEVTCDRSISNDIFLDYHDTATVLGVRWDW